MAVTNLSPAAASLTLAGTPVVEWGSYLALAGDAPIPTWILMPATATLTLSGITPRYTPWTRIPDAPGVWTRC